MKTYLMNFYGIVETLESWAKVVETIQPFDLVIKEAPAGLFGHYFSVELTAEQREYLQKHHWYDTEDETSMPWNYRITFDAKEIK